MLPGNQEAIEAWNTVLFDKFSKQRATVSGALAPLGERAMALRTPPRDGRVVDIGCGFGDTTLALATRCREVVGVDAAEQFLEVARREAAGFPNVSYQVCDVEEHVVGGPYDYVFARMGTMFFNQPVFALRNMREACNPGATLNMVVWRKKAANECWAIAEQVAIDLVGEQDKGDNITCGPGPFSMASPDLVSDQLHAAGWRDPVFARSDGLYRIGATVDDAIDFAISLGPAGEVMRLAGELAVAKRDQIVANLRDAFAPYAKPDGVWLGASTWIVSATAP
jgi:SAM-dependent methyltransferase